MKAREPQKGRPRRNRDRKPMDSEQLFQYISGGWGRGWLYGARWGMVNMDQYGSYMVVIWWLYDGCRCHFSISSGMDIKPVLRMPVVPHKAVAEVSKYEPIGEVGCCESQMAERIHWWTERWLEFCFLERLQWLQWSPGRSRRTQLLEVGWCSAAVVVVVMWWSCSCDVL